MFSLSLVSHCLGAHRDLPSFPTRRSSDLVVVARIAGNVHPTRFPAGGAHHTDAAGRVRLAGLRVLHRRGKGVERVGQDRKSTRLNSVTDVSRMPSSA